MNCKVKQQTTNDKSQKTKTKNKKVKGEKRTYWLIIYKPVNANVSY
jgi:hypothetical protein